MDFSKFENPKAANDFLKRSKKVSQRKTLCAANFLGNCNGIITAHTLSKKSMLEPVANRENEVYTISTVSLVNHQINLEKKGIGGVSTFKGFCGMHDKDLFTCLDDDEFKCTPKQLFMLAYRTISRELYKKINFPERIPTKKEYINIIGRRKYNKEYVLFVEKIKKHNEYSIQSLKYIKDKLDTQLRDEDWNSLKSHVLLFEKISHPICAATGAFQPLFDISGKIINEPVDYYDEYGEYLGKGLKLRTIIFSIIPVKDMYVVIFSWDNDDVSENFFKSILKQENKSLAAFNIILDNIENFAIYPDWYENLDDKKKEFIQKRIQSKIKNTIWKNPEKYNSMLEIDEFKEIVNWKFLKLKTKLINLKIKIMQMYNKFGRRSKQA